MIETDPCGWTLTGVAHAIGRKQVSPVEVTRALLERIDTHDGRINSFLTVLRPQALKAARAAEREIARGNYRGVLHGVPYAAKDLFLTRGVRTTCGSRILADFVPREDAAVVVRLREAGAILLGKLNLHEFAYGTTSVNPHHGPVRNPWDLRRIAGGSSGGSAAAVAASFALLTLGTDTGGSIRIPAALCGVAGLKPTYGLISRRGAYPLCWSLDHVGPMARTVEDVALALGVLAGHDPRDPGSVRARIPSYRRALRADLNGLRIGLPAGLFFQRLEEDVRLAVESAVRRLRALGASVSGIEVPGLDEASAAAFVTLFGEAASSLERWHRTRADDLGADVRGRLDAGAELTAAEYLKAQRVRRIVRASFLRSFERVDALVTPQLPLTATPISDASVTIDGITEPVPAALTRFTRITNLLGLPSLTVPCGFSRAGLPIGIQVIGAPFAEPVVLRVGHAYERDAGWTARRPPLQ
jgi:aspartyl-tRNA(Asn)/glutamyl-tRNA(Gln) amidotransferase subunit A